MERVVVENVHAMPKQGVSSTFKFGMGVGIIHGVAGALRLPMTLVTPNQWKTLPQPARPRQGSLPRPGDPQVAGAQPPSRPQEGRRPRRGPADRRLVLRPLPRPPHPRRFSHERHPARLATAGRDITRRTLHTGTDAVVTPVVARALRHLRRQRPRLASAASDPKRPLLRQRPLPGGSCRRPGSTALHAPPSSAATASMVQDWRHFQQIKNELAGPEREAVELYPAESRKIDTSNKWHLWVLPEGDQVDFGWAQARRPLQGNPDVPGLRQRPL